ncbi:MAG: DUF4178 domain-containing protein [Paracoccaceae bacterium]
MTRARATSIDCTQCGAGLDLLGGGRVRALVCGFCGAELDARGDYAVLRRFLDLERPATPFALGARGEIAGVAVTVIGTIAKREHWKGRTWHWVEHQLYAPTHGYAWLTLEDGHLSFTRKIRELPRPATLSAVRIETADKRPSVRLGGVRYDYYASGHPRITFVEGEFNFVPETGEAPRYVDLLGPEAMLTIVNGANETEYELTTLPDRAALLASFGLTPADVPRPRGTHPLAPYRAHPLAGFTRTLAFLAAAACGLLALGLDVASGRPVLEHGEVAAGAPFEAGFRVGEGRGLVEVRLATDATNGWGFFEGEITDDEDAAVAAFGREIGYYTGVEDNERWSEGSREGRVRLDLPPGDYTLSIEMTETGDWRGGRPPGRLAVSVSEGVAFVLWLWFGAGAFALAGLGLLAPRLLHRHRRWSGSDWSDD